MATSGMMLLFGCASAVEQDERDERDGQQQQRGAVGLSVLEILHLIVDGDGKGACGAGDIAADHEDDTEFADRVREAEGRSSGEGAQGERQKNFAQDAQWPSAEQTRLFDEGRVDRVESGGERLHSERQAIDYGADDQTGEGEGERMAE